MMRDRAARGWLVAVALVALAGCDQGAFGDADDAPVLPDDWGDADVVCVDDGDCGARETCAEGTCQMRRCDDGPYPSAPPLGASILLRHDVEVLVSDAEPYQGQRWVDLYLPGGGGVTSGASLAAGGATAAVASGQLLDAPGEQLVTAPGGDRLDVIAADGQRQTLHPGFTPTALTTGDVDGDHRAEIIAGASGRLAVCDAVGGTCTGYTLDADVRDLGAGDVDGDGDAEVVALAATAGGSTVLVWDVAGGDVTGGAFSVGFAAVEVGDLDGDGVAEVLALEDGGWLGLAGDRIDVYRVVDGTLRAWFVGAVSRDAIDLAVGDLDGGADRRAEVVVLGSDRVVEVFAAAGALTSRYRATTTVTRTPARITVGDLDGDSATARLVRGPDLVAGPAVPTMVVTFPPHDALRSRGLPEASVGRTHEVGESLTDTVSLEAGLSVGVEAGFLDVFSASLSTTVSRELSWSRGVARSVSTGEQFAIEPEPELFGTSYGAVVLSCACFHAYTYELDDPRGQLGGDGGRFVVVAPVGGQTTIWSSARYNELAARTGLPVVPIATVVGDPATYPRTPTTLDGQAVADDDLVFPVAGSYRVSDVGTVGFGLAVGTSTSNEAARSTSVSIEGTLSAALGVGVELGGTVGVGAAQAYSVEVGDTAEFGGSVPPIPDDPGTPEDEYALAAYSYAPVVYRQRYLDADGHEAGYYVLTYAVGP